MRRGITIQETLGLAVAAVMLLAIALPVLARQQSMSSTNVSHTNLMVIGVANAVTEVGELGMLGDESPSDPGSVGVGIE